MGEAVAAFDRHALSYDEGFGRNPVGLLYRHIFQERLRALIPPGSRVLDIGCGTGEDAVFLAARGVEVHGLDPAPAMVAQAREKARRLGISEERCRFTCLAAEETATLGAGYDGAYSNFGALNCASLPAVGRSLAAVLRPGSPLVISLLGPWPLPGTLRRLLTAQGEPRRGSRPRVAEIPVPVSYPSLAEAQWVLGPEFRWLDAFALGVLMPAPSEASWCQSHPQTFGVLAALEGLVRRWPLLRGLGDHVVIEGRRK